MTRVDCSAALKSVETLLFFAFDFPDVDEITVLPGRVLLEPVAVVSVVIVLWRGCIFCDVSGLAINLSGG